MFFVTVIVLMTELNRSDITMWFPSLTDLVFFRAYAIVRVIKSLDSSELEMSIPRRAVIHEGIPRTSTPSSVCITSRWFLPFFGSQRRRSAFRCVFPRASGIAARFTAR